MENSDGYFSHHLIGRRAHTRLGVEGHVENQPPAIDGSWKKVLFGFFSVVSSSHVLCRLFCLLCFFLCPFCSFLFLSMSWHVDIRDSFEHLNI